MVHYCLLPPKAFAIVLCFTMEISQLRTFSVVAKKLHFTNASKELNLTQSAVSYQIKSLEEEVGEKLFVREKGKISLTNKGKVVLAYASKIFQQIEVMKRDIEDNKDSLKGKIKLIAITRSLNSPFPKIKLDFRKKYKDIELTLETVQNSETVLERVRRGSFDIGFTTQTDNFGDLLAIPYGEFEMLFVVGKDHSLSKMSKVSLEDLKDEEWILFEKDSWLREKTDKIFSQKGFVPQKTSESNDGAIIRELIKNGAGVGFLPSWGIFESLELGRLIDIEIVGLRTKIPLNMVISQEKHSKLVSLFVDYLLERQVSGIHLYKKTQKKENRMES